MKKQEAKPVDKESTISSDPKDLTKLDKGETATEKKENPVEEVAESVASCSKSKLKRMKKKEKKEEGEKVVMRATSDSKDASHSFHIRRILAEYDIVLPYDVNLDAVEQFLEKEIHGRAYLIAKWGGSLTIRDVSDGQRLLSVFQAFPPIYYKIVRENLPSIKESFNDYIVSCAKERSG